MNQAHWHLVLNHLPILGTLFGILVLLAGFLVKHGSVKQTGLGLFVFSALIAIPAFLTGEGAEDAVEGLPGVGENLIERHEDLANFFLWTVIGLGVLALITLLASLNGWKAASLLSLLTLLVALGTMILAQQVGTSGGEIRHSEIRANAVGQGTLPYQGGEHDDD
ncbi:MAG: hypothetical protein IPJ06_11760 [Saprospiraceae bacterium]|nr:hypothetical protein [Saprospiraceae bacterium]